MLARLNTSLRKYPHQLPQRPRGGGGSGPDGSPRLDEPGPEQIEAMVPVRYRARTHGSGVKTSSAGPGAPGRDTQKGESRARTKTSNRLERFVTLSKSASQSNSDWDVVP